jgi:hypothetical protein
MGSSIGSACVKLLNKFIEIDLSVCLLYYVHYFVHENFVVAAT